MNRIKALNKILIEAILHGGDPGGAYFCNSKNLKDALNRWLKINNLNDQYKVSNGCYCLIVPINGPDYDGWQKEKEMVERAYKYKISENEWNDIF